MCSMVKNVISSQFSVPRILQQDNLHVDKEIEIPILTLLNAPMRTLQSEQVIRFLEKSHHLLIYLVVRCW